MKTADFVRELEGQLKTIARHEAVLGELRTDLHRRANQVTQERLARLQAALDERITAREQQLQAELSKAREQLEILHTNHAALTELLQESSEEFEQLRDNAATLRDALVATIATRHVEPIMERLKNHAAALRRLDEAQASASGSLTRRTTELGQLITTTNSRTGTIEKHLDVLGASLNKEVTVLRKTYEELSRERTVNRGLALGAVAVALAALVLAILL